MTTPRVSILLPVYNAAAFLADTLASLLAQTLPEWELIAINDGSTDGSGRILRDWADPRMRVIERENRGLAVTLNEGLLLARAPFIARMDADDLALPDRLARQVAFLDAHPDIAILGTQIESFGVRTGVSRYPTDPDQLACALIFRCPLAHPTVMLRRELLAAGLHYDPGHQAADDYALWLKLSRARVRMANLPEVLLRYRTHPAQMTAVHLIPQQQQTAAALQLAHLREMLGVEADEAEAGIHAALSFDALPADPAFPPAAARWLERLYAANATRRAFPAEPFARTLTGRFVALVRHARSLHGDLPIAASPFAPYIAPGACDA